MDQGVIVGGEVVEAVENVTEVVAEKGVGVERSGLGIGGIDEGAHVGEHGVVEEAGPADAAGADGPGGQVHAVVRGVSEHAHAELADVGERGGLFGTLEGFADGGNGESGEEAEDDDDDQKFDEGEGAPGRHGLQSSRKAGRSQSYARMRARGSKESWARFQK